MNIKKAIKSLLMRLGLQVRRIDLKDTPVSLWDKDAVFNGIFREISGRTIVDKIRCYMIYQYARQAAALPGEVAEVGVYKGGTAKLLARVFKGARKTVHLFDTFAGMPLSDSARDTYKEGDFGDTSFDSVKTFLTDCDNIRIYKGVFPLEPNPVRDKTFCMVHVDADIYRSVKDCCEFFYPRLEKGGVMLFDDYGFPLCPGAKAAVDEFFADKPEKPIYLPTGQCALIRI